jgi:hypothetical protein
MANDPDDITITVNLSIFSLCTVTGIKNTKFYPPMKTINSKYLQHYMTCIFIIILFIPLSGYSCSSMVISAEIVIKIYYTEKYDT